MAILCPFPHPPLEPVSLTGIHNFYKLDGRLHKHICRCAILACMKVKG